MAVGRTYRYAPGGAPCGCLYVVEALAYDPEVGRELVVHRCVSGRDAGVWFVATPAIFAAEFEPADAPAPAAPPADPPPPEKPAGYVSTERSQL